MMGAMAKLALVIPVGLIIGGAVLLLSALLPSDVWVFAGATGSLVAGALLGEWAYNGNRWVAALGAVLCLVFAWIGLILVFAWLWSGVQLAPAGSILGVS
jgi:hypothetical protein